RALLLREPEELRHEVDVVVDAQLEVEVLAQALRHVRDLRAHLAPVADVGDVAVQHRHRAFLERLRAGHDAHERGLAHAVGADDADHEAARDVERDTIQGLHAAVAVRDALDGDDRLAGRVGHPYLAFVVSGAAAVPAGAAGAGSLVGTVTRPSCSHSGHAAFGSTLT